MNIDLKIADDIQAVVSSTLHEPDSNITNLLECLANRFAAFGCGLWEIIEDNSKEREKRKYLVTLAAWWSSGELFAMDDVPVDNSPTGQVAMGGQSIICDDIQQFGGAKRSHPFWARHNIRGMCAAPVRFLDGGKGALNIYRQGNKQRFTQEDKLRLDKLALLIPGLYKAVREKIGLRLLQNVDDLLRKTELEDPSSYLKSKSPFRLDEIKVHLNQVCGLVRESFNCIEVSIYLEKHDSKLANDYECVATTTPLMVKRKIYSLPRDQGRKTGWVLENKKPLSVLDISKYKLYKNLLLSEYPGLKNAHRNSDVVNALDYLNKNGYLKLQDEDETPPLSFMAAPILGGMGLFRDRNLCGAIRCFTALSGPYYFCKREVDLLSVVATQVGQWWVRWCARIQLEQEKHAWEDTVGRIAEINTFVRRQLAEWSPDESTILREALRLTSSVIPGAVLNGIRLYDADTNELYFTEFSKEADKELQRLGKEKNSLRRFPVKKDSEFAGVKVFLTGNPEPMPDVTKHNQYHTVFPSVKQMLIVPVGVGNTRYGVLDLRWTTKSVPPYAEQIAVLLGQQIGLYHELVKLVLDQKKLALEQKHATLAAQKHEFEEITAIEDFSHQLISPISLAIIRTTNTIELCEDKVQALRLRRVRGLIRRAERVAVSMRMLANLSHRRPLNLKRIRINSELLVVRLIELASDTQLAFEDHNIAFRVDRASFDNKLLDGLFVDFNFLEQMLANLLDNAGKYSYPNSTVRIFGGITHSGRPFFAIANKGFLFGPGETEKCKIRGWRSERAKAVSPSGHGIGLWLVNEIMKAHQGELQIISPNKFGENEFRLLFKSNSNI